MTPYLDSFDPRLGIHAAAADLREDSTRYAIRAVMDAVAMPVDTAAGAPSLGYPVRVMAVRIGDVVHCILNPVLASAGPMFLSCGERNPHTGPMRRDVWRSRSLTLGGTGVNGKPLTLTVSEGATLAVQQALELMDDVRPFSWMTSFHHIWHNIRKHAHAARFQTVSEGLFARDAAQDDLMRLLDRNNPMVPVRVVDRALFALMLQLTGMRKIYLSVDDGIGLAVSLTLSSPAAQVWIAENNWPRDDVHRLGLSACVLPCADLPEGPLDAVVLSATEDDLPDMAQVARVVSGASGAVMVVSQAPDASLEDILQRSFACLCRFDVIGGGIIYVARKSTFNPSETRPRLMLAASRIGAQDTLLSIFSAQWMLRKDGQKVAL